MPFSHHSHSGQFCGHAKNTLEEVLQEAIAQKMEVFCLTEHMPRDHHEDLYIEEVAEGITPEQLQETFAAYMIEARRLREKYGDQLRILIGTETDWIRPVTCLASIRKLFETYDLDLFVGSVHHVHTIPIDFNKELLEKAIDVSMELAGSESSRIEGEALLAADYFDLQLSMLQSLEPPVVGHFDLIRLFSDFERDGKSLKQWPDVWQKVTRNLAFIQKYGGRLEINSAGLRKGLKDPYPNRDVCELFLTMGGQFVLSDDSHGIAQVGHSYKAAMDFAESVGISAFSFISNHRLAPRDHPPRFFGIEWQQRSIQEIRQSSFMKRLSQ